MKAGDLVYLEPWLHERCGAGLWMVVRIKKEGRLAGVAYVVHCVTTGEERSFHYTNVHKADIKCP